MDVAQLLGLWDWIGVPGTLEEPVVMATGDMVLLGFFPSLWHFCFSKDHA